MGFRHQRAERLVVCKESFSTNQFSLNESWSWLINALPCSKWHKQCSKSSSNAMNVRKTGGFCGPVIAPKTVSSIVSPYTGSHRWQAGGQTSTALTQWLFGGKYVMALRTLVTPKKISQDVPATLRVVRSEAAGPQQARLL